ncbi:MAG: NUDIX hydrolase [Lentisphaerae bacterium]|nr:NUDIX hydrolase [Lentisphaerota bacterium]
MNRTTLIQHLIDYRTRWPDESPTVSRFIEFLSSRPDAFERSLPTGHVTGSAWLVDASGRHVLLTLHKKLNKWIQLGGHADGDNDVFRVAMREAREESGLHSIKPVSSLIFDIDVHSIPARPNEPAHLHWDIRYALRAAAGEEVIPSDESHELRWVEIANLNRFTREPSMRRMAAKWMRPNG